MRVNIEDSVKRHLPRLSRSMGWNAREAMGALCFFYGATQDAEIYEDTPERIATVCALEFDDDEQCEMFITAMISAQLITVLDDGRLRIRGNEKHIVRLKQLRVGAVAGGLARQQKIRNDFVATRQGDGSDTGASSEPFRSAPYSLLLTDPPNPINGETLTHEQKTVRGDFDSPPKKKNGSRADGTNPRATGTNPRARKRAEQRAKHEQARVAKIEALGNLAKDAVQPEVGLAKLAALKSQFKF
jgi:hypothetical protein